MCFDITGFAVALRDINKMSLTCIVPSVTIEATQSPVTIKTRDICPYFKKAHPKEV
jgi:hypothetical protein